MTIKLILFRLRRLFTVFAMMSQKIIIYLEG